MLAPKSSLTVHFIIVALSVMPTLSDAETKEYHEPGLIAHNMYRALHKSQPLKLDNELNVNADKCAVYYLGINAIDHSCPHKGDAGENIYKRGGVDLDAVAATKHGIKLWYEEIKDYNFEIHGPKVPGNFPSIGHFTQLVWKESEKLGMGFTAKKGTGTFIVSLYEPAGNYKGEYKDNVVPPTAPPPPSEPVKPKAPPAPVQPGSPPSPVQPGSPPSPVQPGSPPSPVQPGSPSSPIQPGLPPSPVQPGAPPAPEKPGTTSSGAGTPFPLPEFARDAEVTRSEGDISESPGAANILIVRRGWTRSYTFVIAVGVVLLNVRFL